MQGVTQWRITWMLSKNVHTLPLTLPTPSVPLRVWWLSWMEQICYRRLHVSHFMVNKVGKLSLLFTEVPSDFLLFSKSIYSNFHGMYGISPLLSVLTSLVSFIKITLKEHVFLFLQYVQPANYSLGNSLLIITSFHAITHV